MKSDVYNTRQKEIILNVIKQQYKEFTVKDIYNQVKDSSGLTTVYRFVDKLVVEGILKKRVGDNNNLYYLYLENCDRDNHFYLKCDKCGKLIHVDCNCVNDLFKHIFDKHGFISKDKQVVIDGVCNNCIGGV